MGSLSQESGKALLDELASAVPGLPVITPASPDYHSIRAAYQLEGQTEPLAIVRPRTAEDVAAVIPLAHGHGVKVTVRSGGHDIFGRSFVEGAIAIDMRPLNTVQVSEDKKTARIGGGTLMGGLLEGLAKFDLITPFGSVPSVGYVGWATLGGYGNLSAHYGLGVDQIVGAKVVNSKGKIVDAGHEMLKGIRGGGGNFGVIVELAIKVYPLKNLLAGVIIFESSNLGQLLPDFLREYTSLACPPELGMSPLVINHPQMGRTLGISFVWSSEDKDTGMEWVNRVQGLAPAIMHTVAEIGPAAWLEVVDALIPYGVWGGDRTVSLPALSETARKIIGNHVEKMPSDAANGLCIHELRGNSAKKNPSSCFGAREPHFMLELIGSTLDPSNMEGSQAWIAGFRKELSDSGGALKGTYVSLSKPGDCRVSDCFGEDWEFLLGLKQTHDPEGVFSLAVPRLSES